MSTRAASAFLASALLLAACVGPDAAPPTPAPVSAPPPAEVNALTRIDSADAPPLDTSRSGASDGTEPGDVAAFEGTTGRTETGGAVTEPGGPALVAVRTARHDGFDRLVFEFTGTGRPAVYAAYAPAPTACGSGDAVRVEGAATLVVSMRPARAHTEAGAVTVSRTPDAPRLPSVREFRMTCDFEAEVTWAIGVAARRPYRVTTLDAPARIVVDVRH